VRPRAKASLKLLGQLHLFWNYLYRGKSEAIAREKARMFCREQRRLCATVAARSHQQSSNKMRSNLLVSIFLEHSHCVDNNCFIKLLATCAANNVVVQYSDMIKTLRWFYIPARQAAFVEDLRNGLHIGWPSRADFDRPYHSLS